MSTSSRTAWARTRGLGAGLAVGLALAGLLGSSTTPVAAGAVGAAGVPEHQRLSAEDQTGQTLPAGL